MARLIDTVVSHEVQKTHLLGAYHKGRLHPVQIFSGPSGIGKKQIALALVQEIFCQNAHLGKACGSCPQCLKVEHEQHENLKIIKPEKSVIKIEKAREIISFLGLKDTHEKVILVDDAHLLNRQASNSLLKSFEESADGVYFLLITNSLQALLPTIRSRGQSIRFSPLSNEDLLKIKPFDPWVLEEAGGSVTTAMELQEESFQEVRNKTIKFFLDWIGRSSSPVDVASFKDILGDRERSRHFILTIQFFINRALHFRSGASHLAQNELNELSLELAQNPQYDLSSWVVSSIQLDRDLQENVDNILSFENFLIDVSPNNICR